MNDHSSGRGLRRVTRHFSAGLAAVCGLTCLSIGTLSTLATLSLSTAAGAADVAPRLPGHIPSLVAQSNLVGSVPAQDVIDLAISLPLRNEAQLESLLRHISDPADPQYGKYLTTAQFTAQFGPTQADYDAVTAFARAQGLTISASAPNRLILNVSGTAQTVQTAFNVKLKQYKAPDGRIFRTPDQNPTIPAALSGKVLGVIGLDTAAVMVPHYHIKPPNPLALLNPPTLAGTGPGGGFSPNDIKTAYNLNGIAQPGSGQVLALFEIGGSYEDTDILQYEQQFNLPNVPLQKVLIDGANGKPTNGGGSDIEVTLDIDMQIALCPNASKIMVYEGISNGDFVKNSIDVYNRIANDNAAKVVSVSYGTGEDPSHLAQYITTSNIFRQMAAQGQSLFISSGDSGAYNRDYINVVASDPASQPYCTAVGGTQLTLGTGSAYGTESVWNDGVGSGGGGISQIWALPSYQGGGLFNPLVTLGSTTHRNIPDVSLNAASYGYAIYSAIYGGWIGVDGTSASSPLWSAYAALVNQSRAAANKPPLGFANPALYAIARSNRYASDFHDITVGNNYVYPAKTGYDDATGIGSFIGLPLLADLTAGGSFTTPITAPSQQLLGNPGFENGVSRPQPWVASTAVISGGGRYGAYDGSYKAWMGGYFAPHTDTLYQTVSIPANVTSATLSFYLDIDAIPTNSPVDTLTLQVRDTNGVVLNTLHTYSNLDSIEAYFQYSYDMMPYKGKTVQIYFIEKDNGLGASFLLDSFGLLVQTPATPSLPSGPPAS